jgi:F420-non-reducing hydrogenase iron-sulfur subunit
VSRFQYPPNTRTIRVLCTGQVDPTYPLKALRHGADGVLVIGCRLGECHYLTGNYHAKWKVDLTRRMIKKIGMNPDRIEMRFISSAEGNKYIEAVKEFTEKVKNIGPNPLNTDTKSETMKQSLDSLISAASGYRTRAIIAKRSRLVEEGNVYKEKIPLQEMESLVEELIDTESVREAILECLKEKTLSCTELADIIEFSPDEILSHITYLRKKNLIDVDTVKERVPYYKRI